MNRNEGRDEFAVIAEAGGTDQRDAAPIPARPRPTQVLTPSGDQTQPVPVAPRMQTAEDLSARLDELRLRYAPFRRRLEGTVPVSRPRRRITHMDFRFESPDETAGCELDDRHNWERVAIPHYTGPAGRWTGWYRQRLPIDNRMLGERRVWIRFNAADYRAHVSVNGRHVGSHSGLFASFEFDVTRWVRGGDDNLLGVRIENEPPTVGLASWSQVAQDGPLDGDKIYGCTGLGWDEAGAGWHHCPPGAGLWQTVWIESRASVFLSDVFVRPIPGSEELELTLDIWQTPESRHTLSAGVEIIPSNFEGEPLGPLGLDLGATIPEMNRFRRRLRTPGLLRWSPAEPWLYVARVTITRDDEPTPCDAVDTRFGVRSFEMDAPGSNDPRAGTFRLNGEEVVLRGANTMGHMQRAVYEGDLERAAEDILIAKAANLNFYRLTQRPVQPEIYNLADELGMMLQTDLPLFGFVRRGTESEVIRQAGEMERLVRQHPSSVVVTLINEPMPLRWKPWSLQRSIDRDELEELLRACSARIRSENPDRVVKACDGDYLDVAPVGDKPDHHCYAPWYTDHGLHLGRLIAGEMFPMREGWRGGCGEYGAEGLDSIDVVTGDYPEQWRSTGPDDRSWNPEPIARNQTWPTRGRWFTPPGTAGEWIARSQAHQAWGVRTLTDAFRRRLDVINSTAVHLLIDAWPAGWMKSLMTVRREPKPGWFELADALTPLAVHLHAQRVALWAGERTDIDVWVFDERPASERGANGVWSIRWGAQNADRIIASGVCDARPQAMASIAIGRIEVQLDHPGADVGRVLVRASLVDGEANPAHTHTVIAEIWPTLDTSEDLLRLRGRSVGLGAMCDQHSAEAIRWLCVQLGARTIEAPAGAGGLDLCFVDPAQGNAQAQLLQNCIEGGVPVFVVPQPEGEIPGVPGAPVVVRKFDGVYHAMPNPAVLPAPASKHADTVCHLWWDASQHRIDHTARSWVAGSGLDPLLSINALGWGREPDLIRVPAIAQRWESSVPVLFDQSRALTVCQHEPRAAWLTASVVARLLNGHE